MTTDTDLSTLILNLLTQEQYNNAIKNANELYLISNIDNSEIFIATYGATTFEEITTALAANKICICVNNTNSNSIKYGQLILKEDSAYYFESSENTITTISKNLMKISSDNIWTIENINTDDIYLTKIDPNGTGSLSLNRKSDSTVGNYSTTLGRDCTASGSQSVAEGWETIATGHFGSHAEGSFTTASASSSHAEGGETVASGDYSHAEGASTTASTYASHAEGQATTVTSDNTITATITDSVNAGYYGHAEGYGTVSYGTASHAEGNGTTASGNYSHAEGSNTTASAYASHAEGWKTLASKTYSHAEGGSTTASGYASHAEGYNTTASAYYSHAENVNTKAEGTASHAEGDSTIASTDYSHAEGGQTTASGIASHAEGSNTTASGASSHAEGGSTTASGASSHAEGYVTLSYAYASHAEGSGGVSAITITGSANATQYTVNDTTYIKVGRAIRYQDNFASITAVSGTTITVDETLSSTALSSANAEVFYLVSSGRASHAEGGETIASGHYSHAEGNMTQASGINSHASGYHTIALSNQFVIGHYNNTSTGAAATNSGSGTGSTTNQSLFVIGNGTSSSSDNAFRVNQYGKAYCKTNYSSSGADYAEYFEWEDLNLYKEDRRGYFVTLDGEKIKIAQPGDYILGVISALPAIIGNGDEDWMNRYIYDEFGSFVYEEYEYETPMLDKETQEIKIIKQTGIKHKENPDYDPTIVYTPREERPEWDAVGMIGVLTVRDDGTCKVNSYCQVAEGGIATSSENGYRVIKRVNDHVIKIVFK